MKLEFPSRSLEKIVVRLPDGMRERLGAAARANKRTVNAEVVQRLEDSFNSSVGVPNFLSEQGIIQMIVETHEKVTRQSPERIFPATSKIKQAQPSPAKMKTSEG